MKAEIRNTAVIIPVYNSAEHLEELIERIASIIPAENIIAVNDGSTDNSSEICHSLLENVIDLSVNMGKGAALKTGFKAARNKDFHFAFTIDSDLQHNPQEISGFIEKQNLFEADLVIGKRNFRIGKMPFLRILSNRITSLTITIFTGKKILDSQSGYRLYNLDIIENLNLVSDKYQLETELIFKIIKAGGNIEFVPIETIYKGQKSHISHLRDIRNFIKIIFDEILCKAFGKNR